MGRAAEAQLQVEFDLYVSSAIFQHLHDTYDARQRTRYGPMRDVRFVEQLRLCVVSDDKRFAEAMGYLCNPSDVPALPLEGIIDDKGMPTPRLDEIIESAQGCDCILAEWSLDRAPLIGILAQRSRTVPAPLVVICRDGEHAQIAALLAGADRVLTVPFSSALLRATIYADLRSQKYSAKASEVPITEFESAATLEEKKRARISAGPFRVDRRKYQFFINDEKIPLPPRQFEMWEYMLRNPDRLITRDEFIANVWGVHFRYSSNLVDVYVSHARRLLESYGLRHVIETVQKEGYRLAIPDMG